MGIRSASLAASLRRSRGGDIVYKEGGEQKKGEGKNWPSKVLRKRGEGNKCCAGPLPSRLSRKGKKGENCWKGKNLKQHPGGKERYNSSKGSVNAKFGSMSGEGPENKG